jgi:cytochrome b pre-mRNA-processing protein 3
MDGRLELVYAHAALVLMSLRRDPDMAVVAQLFTDGLFRHLDAGLREAGIGDLSVPKHMKRLAQAFYGRVQAYQGAVAAQDVAALRVALERNVFGGAPQPFAADLAQYLIASAKVQAQVPAAELSRFDRWAAVA